MRRSVTPLIFLMILGCPDGSDPDPTPTDPCAPNPCADGVDCTAMGAQAVCGDCPAGLEGDGVTCTEIDGCASEPCFTGVECSDRPAPMTGFDCGPCPMGFEGDGLACDDIDGCRDMPCFPEVTCTDVAAPGEGFSCGECPPGLEGDGVTCTEIDGCAGEPCLPTTTCTDRPAPAVGFTCSPCIDPSCPELRALAGPDQELVIGATTRLVGDAVGFNGAFTCAWTNDQDRSVLTTCSATVAPTVDTIYTLTVTDASSAMASDDLVIRRVSFAADAGPDRNILTAQTATLTATWRGASCVDESCIRCRWRTSDGNEVGDSCTLRVSPAQTTPYFVTVTDVDAQESATDTASVYVTDRVANLCGWDVVVLTSNEYPTSPNPNYICDDTGAARRQTINGKPAIVLSDLVVHDVRIIGHIGVETTSDDDLIGFLWGWQSPAHTYLISWKQRSQNWTARCGNAPAGFAIKKIDGAVGSSTTVSFNPAFGFNATDYVYSCADLWSTSRANADLLSGTSRFLSSPSDPVGGVTEGWRDGITYRFEFYYTPARTRVVVYADDLKNGSTDELVATFDVVDTSYPEGAFAFFSNSQAQVEFGDFVLASLDDFAARAGPDQTISAGSSATLSGAAELAVPPYRCEWSSTTMVQGDTCVFEVSPDGVSTTYTLTVTDAFGRVATDDVVVTVTPEGEVAHRDRQRSGVISTRSRRARARW